MCLWKNFKGIIAHCRTIVSEEIWELMFFLAACRKCLRGSCRVSSGGQKSRWVHIIRPWLLDHRTRKTLDIDWFLHQMIWSMTRRSCKTAKEKLHVCLVLGESVCELQISVAAAYNFTGEWEREVFASLTHPPAYITVNSSWVCLNFLLLTWNAYRQTCTLTWFSTIWKFSHSPQIIKKNMDTFI
jgi:hypothetical protein